MIALLDTSDDIAACAKELGVHCEQLLTPLTRFRLKTKRFAVDNGCFSGFDEDAFKALLIRESDRKSDCLWVAAPDVVGSARRTLECWEYWHGRLKDHGWPCALVAQDGIEDLAIPWREMTAIFIGGSTKWKMSQSAVDVIRAGKILGKWVHVGRVNTPGRFEHFEALGADSIDGTGLSRYTWMRQRIHERDTQPRLFEGCS